MRTPSGEITVLSKSEAVVVVAVVTVVRFVWKRCRVCLCEWWPGAVAGGGGRVGGGKGLGSSGLKPINDSPRSANRSRTKTLRSKAYPTLSSAIDMLTEVAGQSTKLSGSHGVVLALESKGHAWYVPRFHITTTRAAPERGPAYTTSGPTDATTSAATPRGSWETAMTSDAVITFKTL